MGDYTNRVRARELFPKGPGWLPGFRVVHFPMVKGHVFELWIKCHAQIPGLDIKPHGRWVGVEAAEPIERWEVGVVLLAIRGKVYQVRITESGECVLLREHKGEGRG